jgi:type II restriction/modification system DNA methylase subunit YeeA
VEVKMETLTKYIERTKIKIEVKEDIKSVIKELQNSIKDKDEEDQVRLKIYDMIKLFPEYEVELHSKDADIVLKDKGTKQVVAFFECKSLSNEPQMINEIDINKKALHELIYYFLKAYKLNRDDIPTYLVVTNGKKWFVFNNTPFRDFAMDEKALGECSISDRMLFRESSTSKIYENIENYLATHEDALKNFKDNCFHFSSPEDIYHFLSPDILLNKYNPSSGSALNKEFYDELLYIFGLKEVESNGKKTIIPNEVPNTFYSQISEEIKKRMSEKQIFEKIKEKIFEKTKEQIPDEQLTEEQISEGIKELTLDLIIIWLNRILFLKLFEAKLVEFNDNKTFTFMDKAHVPNTIALKSLFFDVLAVPENQRGSKAAKFGYVPYLNSSLFEEKEIEKDFPINDIQGDDEIPYYTKTVLHTYQGEKFIRKQGATKLLDYLFEFLNAYNFREEGDPSSLISPAVLGLVFEKINGYKDGSYYTPTDITDYMAKTAIEKAILSKVKEQLGLDYSDFGEFKKAFFTFSEEGRKKIREIIRNLTILDPAVGSGHFLVSSLNVLLQIWYDFGMIDIPKKYEVKFENGDIKLYKNDKPFVYRKNSSADDTDFQQKVFKAKKEIIENNLFGVDINPKATEIARLRLWIELLKNAYYREDGKTMETLPNIDINIKVGDSLLARTDDANTGGIFISKIVPELKRYFKDYQNTSDKEVKKSISDKINKTREEIIDTLKPSYDKLLWTIDFPQTLNEEGLFIGFDVVIGNPPYIQLQENNGKLANLYEPLKFDVFERTGDIYELFIEKAYNLLTNKGVLSFITSNKWMRAGYGKGLRKFLRDKTTIKAIIDFCGYKVFPEATVDTNILIVSKEKPAQTEQGTIEDKVTFEFLNVNEDEFVNSYNENIAEYFSEKKGIMQQNKLSYDAFVLGEDKVLALKEKIEKIGKPLKDWDVKIYRGILTGFNEAFIIDKNTKEKILANCKTDDERKRTEEIIKPILRGRDIGKYYYKWAGLWLIKIESGWTNKNRGEEKPEEFFKKMYPSVYEHLMSFSGIKGKGKGLFDRDDQGDYWWELRDCDYYPEFEKEKIVWEHVSGRYDFAYIPEDLYLNNALFMITGDPFVLKYLIGILNSRLADFLLLLFTNLSTLGQYAYGAKDKIETIPIPPITPQNQPLVSQIESLVNQILGIKQSNPDADVSSLESQIDNLVYKLYGLTGEEKKIVEEDSNG